MNNEILIENYRGYDIFFKSTEERFYTSIDGTSWRNKQSFSAVKKFIDDHIKDNYKFEPFYIVKTGSIFHDDKKLKVVAIRKDGRFIAENPKGKKEQISDYEEKDWILDVPENDIHFANIAIYQGEVQVWQDKIKAEQKLITAPTLAEVKSKYIQP